MAKALTEFTTKNAVRLGFWGAEEFGKLGSYFYIKSLNSTDTEVNKIRAYLNFDMVRIVIPCTPLPLPLI